MESDYIIEDTDIRRLIVKAVEAREMAYARYSQFKVGAALLAGRENSSDADEVVGRETDSRDRNANEYRVFTGCNIEKIALAEYSTPIFSFSGLAKDCSTQ